MYDLLCVIYCLMLKIRFVKLWSIIFRWLDFFRDVHETFWADSKTRSETHVSETETRDVAASETVAEILKLPRLNVSSRRFPWRMWWNTLTMKKLYRLINLHHGKRFLFVILWDFALYFDNYHWIINGLHHKELQLRCCRHEPLCLSQYASNWN